MTKQICFLFFFLFSSLCLFAQPEKMNRWISQYKNEANSNGYTLIATGGLDISYDDGMIFDIKDYYAGDYLIVIIVDNCTMCQVEVLSTNLINGGKSNEKPSMQYAENMGVGFLQFRESGYAKADLTIYTTSNTYRYGYAMLFKK